MAPGARPGGDGVKLGRDGSVVRDGTPSDPAGSTRLRRRLAIDLWCVYFGASHDAPAFAVWMAASGAIAASYLGAELQTAMSAIEDDHTLLSQ
jgi:hypothetical protein